MYNRGFLQEDRGTHRDSYRQYRRLLLLLDCRSLVDNIDRMEILDMEYRFREGIAHM